MNQKMLKKKILQVFKKKFFLKYFSIKNCREKFIQHLEKKKFDMEF